MAGRAIVDTGFVVALLNASDEHHAWARDQVPTLRGPWLTAEACVSETIFLIDQLGRVALEELFRWLEVGALISHHFLPEELDSVREESLRYRDRWVDFADACIVRLSDRYPRLPVITVDRRDFTVYFRNRPRRRLVVPA